MISILTTIYNGSEFLEECAQSVLLQECEWEWWIGINGHGEGGIALERALALKDPRIHVLNIPEKGRVPALNALRAKATGDWIAILDCDDIWEPEKLVTQLKAIEMAPSIDIIGTFCTYFGEYEGQPQLPSGWISREDIFRSNPIINSSVLIRAGLARWEDRYGLEDYDLWLRAAADDRKFFNIPHTLVRHRIHAASAFNGKAQDLEGLLAFHRSVTVVTAYYPIQSKFSVQEYMKWITEFWPRMQCKIIFYTDPGLVPVFEGILPRAKVVGLPFSSLSAFNRLSPLIWIDAQRLDRENHTPELYAMWYEKKEFVQRAIAWNPFGSSAFVWCDAGIGRYPEWAPLIQGFPAGELVPRGRMLALQIDPFLPQDLGDGIPGWELEKRSCLGGGILASDVEGWNRWNKAYDAMFMRYYLAGRFVGKDQNIMASMVLEDPSLALLVQRPQSLGPIQGWFYLLFFLAGIRCS